MGYVNVNVRRFVALWLLAALFAVLLLTLMSSCASHQMSVVPQRNGDSIVLSPAQVIALMRRADFSDEQIENLGAELRDALAFYGAARIKSQDSVEALFITDGCRIYGAVSGRGIFFYDVCKKPLYYQTR